MSVVIQKNVSLKNKNWFQTGGAAKWFCEPQTPQEFQQALNFATQHNLEIFILGHGANILVSDEGFDGLVIQPKLQNLTILNMNATESIVQAGAGITMSSLIEFCLENNLIGLEEFSGIPGTVGGSVYINLHYFEFLLEQFLVEAQVIHKETSKIITVDKQWFNFGYNKSTLHKKEYFLLSATFLLKKATDQEIMYARGRRQEIIRHRKARYPYSHTCGSFFRNFYPKEVTLISNGKKAIWVAYYLDKIGVKGQLKKGDAIVSYQHANMLVNQGKATTTDIIEVAKEMQQLVHKNFGIIPEPECQLIGFKKYPLLKK